jgi:hypothetical protein
MSSESIETAEWATVSRSASGEPLRTYGKGRICTFEGCQTRLSKYNPTTRCSIR